ncbi:MAG: hypothetical protein JXA96_10710 [Sedimentisphaerales bacterium]|nr:hypothetical protein [Sedimentisphaerales bacterium]
MKKSSVIKICSAVIVFAVISVGIILLRSRFISMPYFEFLKNPKPFVKNVEHFNGKFGVRESKFHYAFETNYNEFYARASEELKKLNFKPDNSIIYAISEGSKIVQPAGGREWYFKDSNGSVSVVIYRNYKLSEEEKKLQKLYTGSIYGEDCVVVNIHHSKKANQLVKFVDPILNKLSDF